MEKLQNDNKLKIIHKSFKVLGKNALKTVQTAYNILISAARTYKIKLQIVITKAEAKYRFLTQNSFEKFKKKGEKKSIAIKKGQKRALRSGNNRKKKTVDIKNIFYKFFRIHYEK